jgi:hypothetical protein
MRGVMLAGFGAHSNALLHMNVRLIIFSYTFFGVDQMRRFESITNAWLLVVVVMVAFVVLR